MKPIYVLHWVTYMLWCKDIYIDSPVKDHCQDNKHLPLDEISEKRNI